MGINEQSPREPPAPSGIFPLPSAWEVTVPSLLMVQLQELYVALDDFAPAHPRDKLNAVALLFATQLWFDIMEYPDGLEETFATSPLSAF
ncbi:hypothetical protein FOFC_00269 [Fusarium oxysporum]|nr:hypothetical protein FOFC_00269 [Fusarium oxysporum]